MSRTSRTIVGLLLVRLAGLSAVAADGPAAQPGRRGDEIVVAGRFYHTGTPVVTWTDPGGFDAYRAARGPDGSKAEANAGRFGTRTKRLSPGEAERVRRDGWDMEALATVVDQFVIHYDAAGTSRRCFRVLHDDRGLSVHFLLDLDGTIYQTLDLQEAAWHATVANPRSVGIEVANVGAYPVGGPDPFASWYTSGADGRTRITLPDGDAHRDRSADLRPSRDAPVVGEVQGQTLRQYDLTAPQYASLVKLTATLCTLFPRIQCDYPRDHAGRLIAAKLPDDALDNYHGLLGHYHVQADKVDPGPAFRWDTVVDGARALSRKRTNPSPGADAPPGP